MNRLPTLVLAWIFAVASSIGADETRDNSKQREAAVRQYLEIKYDEYDDFSDGGRVIYGPAYNPRAAIIPVDVKELSQVLPTTTFYRTTLETNEREYQELEVIVAVTKTGEKYDIRCCVSPLYKSPSARFLALIHGKAATSSEQRRQLVVGMGKLLAEVTHRGHLKNEKLGERHASVELWHGDVRWRDIDVYFNESNSVEYVIAASVNRSPKQTR